MTEIYKTIKEKALAILKNLFIFQENIHNIRNFQIIANENKNTVRYGLETVCCKTPYWWASLREEYKHQNSAGKFKKKIKKWMYLPIMYQPHVSTNYAALMNKI